jgi:hypothetical protein
METESEERPLELKEYILLWLIVTIALYLVAELVKHFFGRVA